MKKLVLAIIVLIIVAGGIFYWWQNQADVRALNKTLPEGVKVVKSLVGNEYRVVNKIDGYEFKIPPEWEGIKGIEYAPEASEQGYTASSIGLNGKNGEATIFAIDRFKTDGQSINLKSWSQKEFETFGLVGNFSDDMIGELKIVKTREDVHLFGMVVYFFQKDSVIYTITNGSEEFIRYIITNGKW